MRLEGQAPTNRVTPILLFLLFLVVTQAVSSGLEWLLIRQLAVVQPQGRPWEPQFFYVWESTGIAGALAGSWVVARLYRLELSDLGFGTSRALSGFARGAAWGFAVVTLFTLALASVGDYSLGRVAMGASSTVLYTMAWLSAMMATAFAGEMVLHGAGLLILAEALGFWPAAALLSLLGAVLSLGSGGQGLNYAAALDALVVGGFICYTVRHTGAIWFACGFHALMDFSSLFVYGSPSRGNQGGRPIDTRLFTGGFHGPQWLTGGTSGVQSSWLMVGVVTAACVLYWTRSARQTRPSVDKSGNEMVRR